MHIDQYEGLFIRLAAVMMGVFAAAVVIAVFGLGIQLPGAVEQIDPRAVDSAPGFSEPGLREIYPGRYEAHIVVQTWQFTPNQITVPRGSEVTFFLTSKDIIHGFKVMDTNVNIMVIPGQVSEVTHTFNASGTYQFYCHEYCGALHHAMSGLVQVTDTEVAEE